MKAMKSIKTKMDRKKKHLNQIQNARHKWNGKLNRLVKREGMENRTEKCDEYVYISFMVELGIEWVKSVARACVCF